ncbi:MAG: diaminopimelate epimerase [Kiritimatiellae bacterium]|nr:diaminopimelate epimerase [Kiritimatiellia bacterium]
MNIPFWKMHGAANDFILMDDHQRTFPAQDTKWIAHIASRHTGVGSEGVILIQPSDQADFRMRFFNPDGNEVEMCGNGARCAARLASEIGVASDTMTIDTVAGTLRAHRLNDSIRLYLTDPKDWVLNQELEIEGVMLRYHSVNSGVPHVVIEVDDLVSTDVQRIGSATRHHEQFLPAGTNANFIHCTGPNTLEIRTYERGVESETLACGTGMAAAAMIAGKLGHITAPVQIIAASRDLLEVDYRLTDDGATDVTLTGPAVHVFQGSLDYIHGGEGGI